MILIGQDVFQRRHKTLDQNAALDPFKGLCKAHLKAPPQASRPFRDIDRANDRIARLTQWVAELEKAQETLIDQFTRCAYRADAYGLNDTILNQSIPKPYR